MTTTKITQVYSLAARLMSEHGLIQEGWRFDFSTTQRRVAVCKYKSKLIEFSLHYITNGDLREIEDILLHEIAHALVGRGHGHDEVWQAKCIEIGAKPQRLASESITQGKTANYNFKLECPNCGKTWYRYRLKRKLIDSAICNVCPGEVKLKAYRLVRS